jgi:hypothetical protein
MIIKEHNFIKCEFDVYKSDNTFLKSGTMSFNQAIRIVHPYANDLKISFYDYHKELLAKYKVMLCDKYKITPDELDSLSYLLFPELDRLRSALSTNATD